MLNPKSYDGARVLEASGRPILQPVLNPKSYDGVRVSEASGRPMLVIGRRYVVSIQVEELIGKQDDEAGMTTGGTTKLAEEITEYSVDEMEPDKVTGRTAGKVEPSKRF